MLGIIIMRYRSIAHEAKGLIVLVITQLVDRKSNNKVCKCKLKKYLFGNKIKFHYSMTTTTDNSPLVV